LEETRSAPPSGKEAQRTMCTLDDAPCRLDYFESDR
jgi:hypothetical protein